MGMAPCSSPWSADSTVKLAGLGPNQRYRDVVDVAYFAWTKNQGYKKCPTPAEARALGIKWFADVSQQTSRKPWGSTCRTFHQTNMTYSFEFDRVLTTEDRSVVSPSFRALVGVSGGSGMRAVRGSGEGVTDLA